MVVSKRDCKYMNDMIKLQLVVFAEVEKFWFWSREKKQEQTCSEIFQL